MKKILFTIFIMFIISINYSYSQFEIRHLPYFIDEEWYNKAEDYLKYAHLKPGEMPEYAKKMKTAPAKMLSKSGVELINISQASSHQSETFIVVNPHNPNNIVVGVNDWGYNNSGVGYRMAAYYSTDAGKTWNMSLTPSNLGLGLITDPNNEGCTNVDPGIGYDSEGNVYYVYLFAQLSDNGAAGDNGVFVCKSYDGGRTWSDNDIGIPVLNTNNALQDKCFIGVDSDPNSPYKNRSYVAWYDTKQPFAIGFSYAEDGLTFNSATTVTGSSGKSVQSPMPVVGPNGVLYLTWEEKTDNGTKTKAVIQKSTNGGVSWAWTNPKTAQIVYTAGTRAGARLSLPQKDTMRISSHPNMDVDLRNGNLYLVQSGKDELNKYGVFLSKSTDGGESWSASPSKIEGLFKIDGNTFGNDVFLPSIAVDPVTGMIAVFYYSSENDTINNKGCDAFLAISFDEGKTFKHIQLTDTWYFQRNSAWTAGGGGSLGRYWGDYTSIDVHNGKIYPCFWMPTVANADFWSCDLFTVNLSTAPESPSGLAYENSWETPTKVILKWTDPAKNQLGAPLADYKIFIYRDWNKIGEVNKGVQEFTDNSAVEGQTHTYALKTVLQPTGEESDFASITLSAGGVMESKLPTAISPKPNESGILLTWTNPVEHIDNSYLHDLNSIDIYIDGVFKTSVQSPQIQAGENSSYLIELETAKFYKLKLKVKTKRGNNTGESAFTNEFLCYAGAPLEVLDENFDNASNITPSYTEGTWGLTTKAANSLPNSLTDSPAGDYPGTSLTSILLAPAVVNQGESTLQISHVAMIAKNDWGKIKVSNDFGNSFKDIKWLNIRRFEGWDSTNFDVKQSQWFTDGIDLSEFEGDTIFIKFELETIPFTNKDGWYIDDVKLGNYPVSVKENDISGVFLNAKLSPNPVQNNAELSFNLIKPGDFNISIYNNIGQNIQEVFQSRLNPGEIKLPLDFSGYSNGLYFIRINMNGTNQVISFIVEK